MAVCAPLRDCDLNACASRPASRGPSPSAPNRAASLRAGRRRRRALAARGAHADPPPANSPRLAQRAQRRPRRKRAESRARATAVRARGPRGGAETEALLGPAAAASEELGCLDPASVDRRPPASGPPSGRGAWRHVPWPAHDAELLAALVAEPAFVAPYLKNSRRADPAAPPAAQQHDDRGTAPSRQNNERHRRRSRLGIAGAPFRCARSRRAGGDLRQLWFRQRR